MISGLQENMAVKKHQEVAVANLFESEHLVLMLIFFVFTRARSSKNSYGWHESATGTRLDMLAVPLGAGVTGACQGKRRIRGQ